MQDILKILRYCAGFSYAFVLGYNKITEFKVNILISVLQISFILSDLFFKYKTLFKTLFL